MTDRPDPGVPPTRPWRRHDVTVRAVRADLPLVLFFVDDLTDPLATTMVASFQDRLDAFARHGVAVQGVVRATAADVAAYVALHGLRVRLVSDEAGDAARALGVDPGRSHGATVVLLELVARGAAIDDLPPHAQADGALGLLAGLGADMIDPAPDDGGPGRPRDAGDGERDAPERDGVEEGSGS